MLKNGDRAVGRWIPTEFDGYADGYPVWDTWECSECRDEQHGEDVPDRLHYCPNCGAEMDSEVYDAWKAMTLKGGECTTQTETMQDSSTVEAPRWIPVTERLPPILPPHELSSATVAVVCEDGRMATAYCIHDVHEPFWESPDGYDLGSPVTLWTPLPPLPKGGQC